MARLRSLPRLLAAAFPSGRARWMWQPPNGQNVLLIFLLNNLLLHTVFLLIFYFLNYTCPTFSILYLALYYSLPTLPTLQIHFFFYLFRGICFPAHYKMPTGKTVPGCWMRTGSAFPECVTSPLASLYPKLGFK